MGKALFGHLANAEVSALREELIRLGARVRVIEESMRSVRRNAPYLVSSVGGPARAKAAVRSENRGDAA
jgi:hypothetical protein